MSNARNLADSIVGNYNLPATSLGNAPSVDSGTVAPFGGTTVPTGWLECDGSAVSRTTYADLFTAIGTTHGSGDGSTTFNVPDLRGEFIRGWDNGKGTDSGRTFGSSQAEELKSHFHRPRDYSTNNTQVFFQGYGTTSGGYAYPSGGGSGSIQFSTVTDATDPTGGAETRPRNIALMYCIKTQALIMFGEFALSERAIAAHGILTFGSATADANFTVSDAGNIVGKGSMELSAIATKTSIGVGVLTGEVESTTNFEISSDLTRFATGVSADVISFDQSSNAQTIAVGAAEQSSNFTQESDGVAVRTSSSENVYSFTKSNNANIVFVGNSESESAFTKDTLGGVVTNGVIDNSFTFDFDETAGILIYRNDFNVEYAFIQTADGALLWEKINANTPAETWTQISISGGTWTPVNANGTIETWIQKVV